jgi:hypothetical protein
MKSVLARLVSLFKLESRRAFRCFTIILGGVLC